MTGIDYPTITVGAHEKIVVRLSLLAQLLMTRRGLDPKNFIAAMAGTEGVDVAFQVFSCLVAENFLPADNLHRVDLNSAPTADYWAVLASRSDDPQATVTAIEKAIMGAVGKAVEERRKRLAVVPPAATEAAS